MSEFEKRVNGLIARVLRKVRNRTAPKSNLILYFTSLEQNTAPFINFPSSITESVVQYKNDHVFTDTTTWAGVKCRLFQLGPFQIKTLCKNVNHGISLKPSRTTLSFFRESWGNPLFCLTTTRTFPSCISSSRNMQLVDPSFARSVLLFFSNLF